MQLDMKILKTNKYKRFFLELLFEDIMFSTKVAIEKEKIFDFVNKLIDNGFENTAYTYLEGFNDLFLL